jgi:general secretion pathway protein L
MATCFLFVKNWTEEGCLCLSLDDTGEVTAPPLQRSFEEIKLLEKDAKSIVVCPADQFGFYTIELPWLPDKKARVTLPFALEEQLGEHIEDLHFSFDKAHYQDGHYLVVVAKIAYLSDLLLDLQEKGLNTNFVTTDWFALNQDETCILNKHILVRNKVFSGALVKDFSELYFQKISPDQTVFTFEKKRKKDSDQYIKITEDPHIWVAKRLLQNKPINLRQGQFKQSNQLDITQKWYWLAGITVAIWLCSFLIIHGIMLYQLNTQTKLVDEQIAKIYKQFFPEAQQVISPKFRIEQFLKTNQGSKDTTLWAVLNKLATVAKNNGSSVQQIKYQNQMLQVTLNSDNFETLEKLENALQKEKISVRQLQASTQNKQVVSILELKL